MSDAEAKRGLPVQRREGTLINKEILNAAEGCSAVPFCESHGFLWEGSLKAIIKTLQLLRIILDGYLQGLMLSFEGEIIY